MNAPPGTINTTPTEPVELSLQQLRVAAKSLGRTRDVELRKLGRLKPGTEVHTQVQDDYQLLDSVAAAVDTAISRLVRS